MNIKRTWLIEDSRTPEVTTIEAPVRDIETGLYGLDLEIGEDGYFLTTEEARELARTLYEAADMAQGAQWSAEVGPNGPSTAQVIPFPATA